MGRAWGRGSHVVVGMLSPQLPLLGSAKDGSALAPPPSLETLFRGRIILVKGSITPLAPPPLLPFHQLPSPPSLFSNRNETFITWTWASLEGKSVKLVICTWVSPAQNFRCLIHKSCHPCKPPDFIMNNSSSFN